MIVWIIVCIACCIIVGVLFAKRDESFQRKRKLQRIRKRLAEIEKEKEADRPLATPEPED